MTIATYQVMTTRRKGVYSHLELFDARDWGLIVYDEVHLLPAPIFRMTADLQTRRRIGLTATLVREDGREGDVFSLIGPKRYDAPWKDIEAQGWIAPADCIEVRVTWSRASGSCTRPPSPRTATGSRRHPGEDPAWSSSSSSSTRTSRPLVIGQYIDQLDELGERLERPVIKGETTVKERQRLFQAFRTGEIELLVVSQGRQLLHRPAGGVGGHPGVRAPSARARKRPSVSAGCFAPRSDGRPRGSTRSSPATPSTPSSPPHRQRFLAEQGYAYTIVDAENLFA